MTTVVFNARRDTQPAILVQFYDPATGDPLDLTGATDLSAKLVSATAGELVASDCSLVDAATGQVSCLFVIDSESVAVGVYALTVSLTDVDSRVQKYPLRLGQMLVDIQAAA